MKELYQCTVVSNISAQSKGLADAFANQGYFDVAFFMEGKSGVVIRVHFEGQYSAAKGVNGRFYPLSEGEFKSLAQKSDFHQYMSKMIEADDNLLTTYVPMSKNDIQDIIDRGASQGTIGQRVLFGRKG